MVIPGAAARDGMRYTRVAMGLHWLIATLIVANLGIGLLRGPLPALGALMPAHKAIGLSVLALTLVRLGWRLTHPAPRLPATTPAWQKGSAHLVHAALYLLMLAMPVTGWLLVSGAERHPLSWFGLFPVPYLPVSSAAADRADGAHLLLGWLMLALVALHVSAALYHRLILRDGVLGRMAPLVARPAGAASRGDFSA